MHMGIAASMRQRTSSRTAGTVLCVQGASYRGMVNTTTNGYTCQRWDVTTPNFHTRIPSAYPDAGLVDNYCRNPDNEEGLWCYTIDGPRWEYCGVPACAPTDALPPGTQPPDLPGSSGTPARSPGSPNISASSSSNYRKGMLIGAGSVVAGAVVVVVVVVALFLKRRRHRLRAPNS